MRTRRNLTRILRSCRILLPLTLAVSLAACAAGSKKKSSSHSGAIALNSVPPMLRMVVDYIPKGRHGRWKHRPMKPRYITIHSTQNYTGDARAHAKALNKGALRGNNSLGYLTWHFTVDDSVVMQHLPLNERGEHADFDGPGNLYSIGIEMCEHRGNNLGFTIDKTARLAAYLMHKENIPLRNVVPHYHWPREGRTPAHKNCPHFLMDNGKPGRKWQVFLRKVEGYYKAMS